MKSFAYNITVNGQRRVAGTVHADSMEDAVRRLLADRDLTIERKGSVIRLNGAIIPQAEWMFRGEKASVCIWVPPEYY